MKKKGNTERKENKLNQREQLDSEAKKLIKPYTVIFNIFQV